MLEWLLAHWGALGGGLLLAGYFALYVKAIRHRQDAAGGNVPALPCDRC